jgi:hypothetical protein
MITHFFIRDNEFIQHIARFINYNNQDRLPNDWELYPVVGTNQKGQIEHGCLSGDDRRKNYSSDKVHIVAGPNNKVIEKFKKVFDMVDYASNPSKYFTCRLIYILQNIYMQSINIKEPNTMYDIIKDNIQLVKSDIQVHNIVKDIVKSIYLMSFQRFMTIIRSYHIKFQMSAEMTSKLQRIITDVKNGNVQDVLIRDFFLLTNENVTHESIFGIIDSCIRPTPNGQSSVIAYDHYLHNKEVVDNVYAFLKTRFEGINETLAAATTTTEVEQRIIWMLDILRPLDASMCKHVLHDDDETLFRDYKMIRINRFININKGYCYTHESLGYMVVANRSLMLPDGTIPSKSETTSMAKGIARFYFDRPDDFARDIIPVLRKTYTKDELAALADFFKMTNYDNEVLFLEISGMVTDKEKMFSFFRYMITDFKLDIEGQSVRTLFKYNCSTFMDMLGFLGYICYSDDVSTFENDGTKFKISQYCIDKVIGVLEEMNTIKTMDGETVRDKIYNLKFNGKNVDHIVKSIPSTCIHGVGVSLMKFYLNANNTIREFVQKFQSKCIPNDEDREAFTRLGPFVCEIPESLKSEFAKNGIYCMTCVRFEVFDGEDSCNQHNADYVVVGIGPEKSVKLAYIKLSGYTCTYDIKGIDSYFNGQNPYFEFPKTDSPLSDMLVDKMMTDNRETVSKLLAIPLTFQMRRKAIFTELCKHVVHMCHLVSKDVLVDNVAQRTKYDKIKQFAQMKVFDIIEGEEKLIAPKHVIIVDTGNDALLWSNSGQVNANTNANTNVNKKKIYIDNLENFGRLEYSYDASKDKASIIIQHGGAKDVTAAYQHSSLLYNVLFPMRRLSKCNMNNLDLFVELENYFLRLNGTALAISSHLFSKLKLENYEKANFDRAKRMNMYAQYGKENVAAIDIVCNAFEHMNLLNCQRHLVSLHTKYIIYKLEITPVASLYGSLITNTVKYSLLFVYSFVLYSLIYLPSTITDPNSYIKKRSSSSKNVKLINSISSAASKYNDMMENIPKHKDISSLCTSIDDVINSVISFVSPHGIEDGLLQYHFTEMNNSEFYMLKEFKSRLSKVSGLDTNYITRTSTEFLNFVAKFDATMDILNSMFAYYMNNFDISLGLNEPQESIRLRFEYFAKTHVLNSDSYRMFVFRNFESIINTIIDLNDEIPIPSVNSKMINMFRTIINSLGPKNIFSQQIREIVASVNITNKMTTHQLVQLMGIILTLNHTDRVYSVSILFEHILEQVMI